jgi:hypothetical protein
MANSSEQEQMIGGYGSDDKVQIDTRNDQVTGEGTQDISPIPEVVADVSPKPSRHGQPASSSQERDNNAPQCGN